jgi:hypothetical protein
MNRGSCSRIYSTPMLSVGLNISLLEAARIQKLAQMLELMPIPMQLSKMQPGKMRR